MSEENNAWRGEILGLHHVTIEASDLEASLRLYRDVLGMRIVAEFGSPSRRICLLDAGNGSHVELIASTGERPGGDEPAAEGPLVHLALATSDAAGAAALVRRAGYEITVEPKTVDLDGMVVSVAFFRGPSGEVVEFFQTH